MNMRLLLGLLLAGLLLVAALLAGLPFLSDGTRPDGRSISLVLPGSVEVGGPFSLVDHTGKAVTDETYRGRWMLVYFGYTFCPDVCPTELQTVTVALNQMGEAAEAVVPLFITVDPARDTVPVMAGFVRDFHPRLVGLTGTEQQVEAAKKAYRVYARKAKGEGAKGEDEEYYLVDHSSYTYFVGPDGKLASLFAYGTPPEKMAEEMRHLIETAR